jgi:rhodanese-related sulfurtransferase
MSILKKLFGSTTKESMVNIKELKTQGAPIVDVRTPEEFMGGHVAGSINIPLHEIPKRLDEVKSMKQPILLCCASGNRSRQAAKYLNGQGIECYNGGSWLDLN